MLLFSFSIDGQKKTIEGTVTAFGGIAVEKAEVMIKKSKTSVFTDSKGFFSIEGTGKDKITVLASGFKKKTIKVSDLNSSGEIQLAVAKGEKGVQMAIENGHITQNVSVKAIKFVNTKLPYALGYNNMVQLVKGKFPNLEVTGSEIILRGRNSKTNSGALIILNGASYPWSSISTFNVNDIKDIKLYTGSEASRFGPGSGNGVLEIILISDQE
ncbi:hypothetical protein GCM10007940_41640 [Portibacter lacus]|uniref:TonB-dependent receptor plug domain-containing protein n=2 Tax=Portibacter lacus TaxID=1099794 RepID=A0AA37SXE0_9BACT|nr:hypothetical protein GCM10007940_41640 [Portibacter lacus]